MQCVLYFPFKKRLQKLLQVKKYRDMLDHEFLRPKNDDYLCDVYDSVAWKDLFGDAIYHNNRIGLLFCVDAIPAFAEQGTSLKPGVLINLSLPPSERAKPENMHLWYVMQTSIKGISQKNTLTSWRDGS